jgi:hypothetical protein
MRWPAAYKVKSDRPGSSISRWVEQLHADSVTEDQEVLARSWRTMWSIRRRAVRQCQEG